MQDLERLKGNKSVADNIMASDRNFSRIKSGYDVLADEALDKVEPLLEEHNTSSVAHEDMRTVLEMKANKKQSGWTFPELSEGWELVSGYHKPAFRKDEFGLIHVTGIARPRLEAGQVIFTLPVGFRPSVSQYFPCTYDDLNAGVIAIHPSGDVGKTAKMEVSNWVTLGGIIFEM